jgi:hypothetical protein
MRRELSRTIDPGSNLEKGVSTIILVAFFLLVISTGIVLSLEQSAAKRQVIVHQTSRLKAFYLAEAGVHMAIARLNSDLDPNVDGSASVLKSANTTVLDANSPILRAPTETFSDILTVIDEGSAKYIEYGVTDVDGDGFSPNFAIGSTFAAQKENFAKAPDGSFRVRVSFPNGDKSAVLIRCYAVYKGNVRILNSSAHANSQTNLFEAGYGIFGGDGGVSAGGQIIDSYRSSKGYPPLDPDDIAKVTVGSNTTIDLKGNSLDLQGFLGSALGPDAITASEQYQAAILVDKLPTLDLPDLNKDVPATNDNGSVTGFSDNLTNGDFSLGSNKDATIGTGYTEENPAILVATEFSVKGTLTIEGHVELHIDSLAMSAQSEIILAEGASVTIYLTGGATLNGGGLVNTDQIPSAFQIYSNSADPIKVTGSLEYYGLLYAPEATITATGNSTVYGGIAADTLKFNGSLEFHYDLDLGEDIAIITNSDTDVELSITHELTDDPTAP